MFIVRSHDGFFFPCVIFSLSILFFFKFNKKNHHIPFLMLFSPSCYCSYLVLFISIFNFFCLFFFPYLLLLLFFMPSLNFFGFLLTLDRNNGSNMLPCKWLQYMKQLNKTPYLVLKRIFFYILE
jgi:hypothetical protein